MKSLILGLVITVSGSAFAGSFSYKVKATTEYSVNLKDLKGTLSIVSPGHEANCESACSTAEQSQLINLIFSSGSIFVKERATQFAESQDEFSSQVSELFKEELRRAITSILPSVSEKGMDVTIGSLSCKKKRKVLKCSAELDSVSEFAFP